MAAPRMRSRLRESRLAPWVLVALIPLAWTGCAVIHQGLFGDVDSQTVLEGRRFEILVSHTGVDIEQAAELAKLAGSAAGKGEEVGEAADLIKMFQMGPRTGNPVFDDTYTDKVMDLIKTECPSGRISGLMSIRESANYPVVSGEIVKLVGYCEKETG